MKTLFTNFLREEEGQDLIEYSLILAFVALAAVGAFTAMSGDISTIWSKISAQLSTAASQGSSS